MKNVVFLFAMIVIFLMITIISYLIWYKYICILEPLVNSKNLSMHVKQHIYGNYIVYEIYNILSPQECKYMIQAAKNKGLEESMVWNFDKENGNILNKDHRKSKQTWLSDSENEIAQKISDISEYITKIPKQNQEMLQIAMYEPLGKFNDHFDACNYDDIEYCNKMNHNSGERRTTLLIYLNNDFEGGETEFVNLGLKIIPEPGKGILFWNTYDDESIIQESKHRGNQVLKGEKWICTKWTHQNKYEN
jgi:prolyl 4-hydroxylase